MDENGDRLAQIMLELQLCQHPSAEPQSRAARRFFNFTKMQQLVHCPSAGFTFFFFLYLATPFFSELDRTQMAFYALVPFGSRSKH